MKKMKLALFLLLLFLFTICLSFIASAEETSLPTKSWQEKPFDKFTIGESYKTIDTDKIYSTDSSFTVDHNGNVYLMCARGGPYKQLMAYTSSGEYLYSIWFPMARFELTTDQEENHIYVACSAIKKVFKFDDNGTLLDIICESDLNSAFYVTPVLPNVSPFGKFRKEETSTTVTIFLRTGGEETVYFQKTLENAFSNMLQSTMFKLKLLIPFVLLLDGVIYKIIKKGKMTDAFFFRCIKKLFSKFEVTKK